MENMRLNLGYEGIEYLVAQLQTLTSENIVKSEITPTNIGIKWGDIKGAITNQEDLISYLDNLKQQMEEMIINASIDGDTDISNLCYLKEQVDNLLSGLRLDIEENLNGYYLKSVVDEMLQNKADKSQVPAKTSDLLNDSGFISEHQDIAPINNEITELKKSLNELSKYVKHYLVLTPEQEQQIQNSQIINETLSNTKTVTIENGTICDIVIPEVTSTTTINAPLEDYTSLELTSPKGVTLNNTGENIVDLDIQAPQNGSNPTVTLKGNYNTINVENASIKVSEGSVNEINISENNKKATSISGILSEDININSQSDKIITITNSNEQDTVNLKLNAENSTVTLNGSYKSVESIVSDNTLIVGQNTHIKKLTVKKGNVIVKDRNINNRIDEIENETDYTVSRYETHATSMSEINSGMQVGGLTIVENDIEQSGSGIAFGILASGNVELNLNGKTIKGGRSNTGLMYIRGTSNVNIVGQGCLENIIGNYGIWVSSVNATVNIYGGSYKATTHCLYAEKGTINVYDGEFRITDEDKKFLLNCLDASYNNGTAHINVFGGKFYGFNPAESMSEINGPVSFVAEGYHVVETEENNEKVYTVLKDE